MAHERGDRPRRSSPRPTIVGALLVAAVATFGAGGNAMAGEEGQGRAGEVRIVIDSVATSAVIPNQAVVQVVAAATAGESYLAAHHLAQLTQALLERAGWQTAIGRRADVEIVLRARQAAVGGNASGMPVLGRWVQLAVVQPRSQAELWSGTAMSIGGCTLGEIGEVLVDELIGRIGTAGTVTSRRRCRPCTAGLTAATADGCAYARKESLVFHDWQDHGQRPLPPEIRQQKARSERAASVVLFLYVLVLVLVLVWLLGLWRTVRAWLGN